MTTLDYAALTSPVTGQDLRDFRESPGVTVPHLKGFAAILAVMAGLVIGAAVIALLVFVVGAMIRNESLVELPLLIAIVLIGGIVIGGYVLQSRVTRIRYLRLHRFAQANGLEFSANIGVPDYPGTIFGIGADRSIIESLARPTSPAVDIGGLRYTTGSGKNRKTHEWGYVAIRLDRMLPQMILDAKANNFLGTNLPVTFSRKQVLSLEGDFDRYFTLYCPKEYERDALYVFTPDLMARLVDEAALLDVEIVDDWMFLYSAKPFDLADRATLERVFRIVDTVGEKTLDRTERYADDRVVGARAAHARTGAHVEALGARMAANIVAPQGRRLKRGLSVGTILLFVAVAIYTILSFTPILDRF
jgi:hypothetical protein